MSAVEGESMSLEEKIHVLQEQGLPKQKIVERIFEENLNADVTTISQVLKMSKLDIGRVKGRLSRLKKLRERAEREAKPKEPPTPYKTELDATAILREILRRHPDIPSKVVDEVCSWAEYGTIHPTQLVYLLQSMRGIQATTANIVAQKYALALQRAQAEGRAQIPPPMYSPQLPQPPSTTPFFPFQTYQQPQPQMFPFQMQPLAQPPSPVSSIAQPSPFAPQPSLYPPYWQPPQDVRSVVKEQIDDMKKYVDVKFETLRPGEERYVEIREPLKTPEGRVIVDDEGKPIVRTVKTPISQAGQYPMYPPWQPTQDVGSIVKGEIEDMKKYVDTKLETLRPREEQYVEIREPLRTPEGKVIVDDEGRPIVRSVRTPVSQASQMMLGGDPELRALEKLKTMREIFKPEKELTAEKVREIVRQEAPKKTEGEVKPITSEEVQKAASEAATGAVQKFIETHEKEEASERRHRELLDAIRTSATEKVVEGYKSDSYRFMGQGMQEMARVIEKKEPIKIIVQGVERLVGATPPPKEIEKGAKEGIFSQIRPEWVAEE